MYVLLIEDDKFFQEFYSFKLKEKGVEVDIASDGEEGLLKIAQRIPDVILLDLIMPKKDGFEVLQELVNRNLIAQIPVLVFSTLGQKSDVEKAIGLGAKGYVNKSFFDFDKLLTSIIQLGQKQN